MNGMRIKIVGDRRVWVVLRDEGETLRVATAGDTTNQEKRSVHRNDVTWVEEPGVGWVETRIHEYIG